MNILHPPNDLDREGQILLTLGDLYGLTIKQMMHLWNWQDYPKATVAFKKQVDSGHIYRLHRQGMGRDSIPGDVYFLLHKGVQYYREEREANFHPAFSFDLKKAQQIKPGGLSHTLLVNEAIIRIRLFADLAVNRLRLDEVIHERRMRNEYKDAFSLYPDGLVRFFWKDKQEWVLRFCLLEIEHTSAHDREKWAQKVRSYINFFENKLDIYLQTDRIFVIVLVTESEYVRHLKNMTEQTLTEMGKHGEEYWKWFCFGYFDQNLPPLEFFATNRFLNPFNKSPVVPFPGLVLPPNR